MDHNDRAALWETKGNGSECCSGPEAQWTGGVQLTREHEQSPLRLHTCGCWPGRSVCAFSFFLVTG